MINQRSVLKNGTILMAEKICVINMYWKPRQPVTKANYIPNKQQ